jgi:hypothetical protein
MIELGYQTTKKMIPQIREKWKRRSSLFHQIVKKIVAR